MSGRFSSTGSIRGFSTLDLGQGQTKEVIAPSNFSLSDLKSRIDEIRRTFNPDTLNDIITEVLTHIQNHNNPHQVTLAQTGADVIQLVYETWLNLGNTGTLQDFYVSFFGTTSANLVTVADITALIAAHNADTSAHEALLDLILPGNPPEALPSDAYDANFSIPNNTITTRSTSTTIIDHNGNLQTIPPNTTAIDYSTGTASFVLYGPRTNLVYPSDPTLRSGSSLLGVTTISSPTGTLRVGPDGNPCVVLVDTAANVTHGYTFPISITTGVEYTDSVFIYPLVSTGGIALYLAGSPTIEITVDLTTLVVTAATNVIGYAQQFPNGWIRIGIQYVSLTTTSDNLVLAKTTSSTLGSPTVYRGTGTPILGIFGLQHVVGCGMSPYIPTTTSSVSNDGSIMQITSYLDNSNTGMLSVSYNLPQSFGTQTRSIISLGTPLSIYETAGQVILTVQDNNLTDPSLQLLAVYNQDVVSVASFAPTQYELGTTGSSKISMPGTGLNVTTGSIAITLGSSTAPMDGVISSLVLYPVANTGEEIEYLIGEA